MCSSLRAVGRVAIATFILLLSIAPQVHARRFPPGPGGAFPDTLAIRNLQDPAAVPALAPPDTVYGIGGIVTGFDAKTSGYALYLQSSGGTPYTGVMVLTGLFNKQAAPYGLAVGDSVVVYGRKQEFQGETEIEGYDGSTTTDDCLVSRVASGRTLPPCFVGTTTQLRETPTNTVGEQYEGMLARIQQTGSNTLRVARTVGLGTNAFLVVDTASPTDSVFVDGNTLATFPAPAVGTFITFVQGIVGQRTRGYRIQLRDGSDILAATPPNIVDAYPLEDDQIRIVFDRDVEPTSAATAGHYTLASFGSVLSAAVDGPAVVRLTIQSGLPHGATETVTVNGVVGLGNGLAMTSPQSRTFLQGVLSCAEVQAPSPDSLFASSCVDRSRFAGIGGQASQGSFGTRCTVRGVAVARFTSLDFVADEAGGFRGGLTVSGVPLLLVPGHRYRWVGQVQEFFDETQLAAVVEAVDLGAAAVPSPVQPSLAVLDHDACDATQSNEDAEDYEARLVRVNGGRVILAQGQSTPPSNGFSLTNATGTDTLFVSNLNGALNPFVHPTLGANVRVTGLLHDTGTAFRLGPRNWSDVEEIFTLTYLLTVTVDGAGSVQRSVPSDTVPAELTVTLTAVPESGQRFVGWTGDVVSSANPIAVLMIADRTLMAHFEPLPRFHVSAGADSGGTVTRSPDLADYAIGDAVTLTATADPGWVFVGWAGDTATLANPLALTVTRDRSVVARFVRVRNGYSACVTASEDGIVSFGDATGGVITAIEFASYGTPTGSCGHFAVSSCHAARSLAVVESLSVGRSAVQFVANNLLFGDPCGGTEKRLAIQYHVEGGTPPGPATATVCRVVAEGARLDLYAPAGMTIDSVLFASYGSPVVAASDTCDMRLGECDASSTRTVVEAFALGASQLSVMATNLVFGDPCPNTSKRLAVKLRCRAPQSDLVAGVPSAWPAAVVPAMAPMGAGAPAPPAELIGDSLGTYVAAAFRADHLTAITPWQAAIAIDGVPVALDTPLPDPAAGTDWYSLRDSGPLHVAGGWHTLEARADVGNLLAEANESNNAASGQWLWRPPTIQRMQIVTRESPPEPGTGPRANCDAFRFVRDPRYAWVMAMRTDRVFDRYRLSVCDDYTGPTSGLSHVLASSTPETGMVDFVVGSSGASPLELFATVVREASPEASMYDLQYSDSRGAFSDVGTGVWSDRLLPANQLVQVFELYFETLAPKYLALSSPNGALHFEVFDQAVAARGSSGSRGWSVGIRGGIDSLVYVPQRIGWHTVVISRWSRFWTPLGYTFLSQDHPVLGAEGEAVPARLELSSPWPNPVRDIAQLQLALPAAAQVHVEVFDVGGRQVRSLHDGALPAGRHLLHWDRRDAGGTSVRPGLYLVQATVGGWKSTRRIVVR